MIPKAWQTHSILSTERTHPLFVGGMPSGMDFGLD